MILREICIVYEFILFDVRNFSLASVMMMITKCSLKSVHSFFGHIANFSKCGLGFNFSPKKYKEMSCLPLADLAQITTPCPLYPLIFCLDTEQHEESHEVI